MLKVFLQNHYKKAFLIVCLILSSGCVAGHRLDLTQSGDRVIAVDRYLDEFCSAAFKGTRIGTAIRDVMMQLPASDLAIVMDRRRPVLFTEIYDSGTARIASSAEIIVTDKDVPAFQRGMTIIKINTLLENGSPEAVMGIVAHELAHRVLDHVRKGHVSCQAEREANRLVKAWGMTKQYEAASQQFGKEKEGGGSASCQEK
jgi:hypothetical protein